MHNYLDYFMLSKASQTFYPASWYRYQALVQESQINMHNTDQSKNNKLSHMIAWVNHISSSTHPLILKFLRTVLYD